MPKAKPALTKQSNFKPLLAGLLIIGLIALGYLVMRSFAAGGSASLYFSPSAGTYTVGQAIAVQVLENSGTDTVNAVQANFTYPSSKLQFQSIDATGSAFSIDASSSGGGGNVSIARGQIGTVTGIGLVATVHFTVLASGSASLTYLGSSAVVRSTDNTNILTSYPGATFTLAAAPTPTPTPVHTPTPTPVSGGGSKTPTPKATASAAPTPSTVAGGSNSTPTPAATTPTPQVAYTSPSATPGPAAKPTSKVLGLAAIGVPILVLLVLVGLIISRRQMNNPLAGHGADQTFTPPNSSGTPPVPPPASDSTPPAPTYYPDNSNKDQ